MTKGFERLGIAVAFGIAGGATAGLGMMAADNSRPHETSAFERKLLHMPGHHTLVPGSRHLEIVDGDILAVTDVAGKSQAQELYAGSVILVDCVVKPGVVSGSNLAWYHIIGPPQFSGDYTDAFNTNPSVPIGAANTLEPKYVDSTVPNCPAL